MQSFYLKNSQLARQLALVSSVAWALSHIRQPSICSLDFKGNIFPCKDIMRELFANVNRYLIYFFEFFSEACDRTAIVSDCQRVHFLTIALW